MKARRLAARLLLLAGITALAVWAAFHRDRLDPTALDAWLSGLGVWAPVAYVALYAVGTVLFVPCAVFAVVGGAMFGPWWGALLNLIGATIGAGLAFLIARYLAGDWVSRKAAGRCLTSDSHGLSSSESPAAMVNSSNSICPPPPGAHSRPGWRSRQSLVRAGCNVRA